MQTKKTNETVRDRLRVTDLVPRILCVVVAFLLWLYVMSNNSPDYERTFSGVTVAVENAALLTTDKNLSVIQGYGNLTDITVTGKKSDVISYSLDDIVASVDVSGITAPGRHSLRVSVSTPDGCVLQTVRPASIEVYVDELSTKTIPVKVNVTAVQYDQEISLGAITPDVSTVTVSGPVSVIDAAKEAVVDLALGTVTTSLTARGSLRVITEDGSAIDNPYLVLSQSSVGVTVPVYVERSLPITVAMKHGYLHEGNAEIKVVPETLTVRADPKVLEGVTSLTVATLDETKIGDNITQIAQISLPEGVENVSGTETASISVRHKGTVKKTLAIYNIRVENPNDLEYSAATEMVNVTFRVPTELADTLLSADFSVVGELAYSGVRGVVQMPLTVRIPTRYKDSVYPIGDYSLTVNIGQ